MQQISNNNSSNNSKKNMNNNNNSSHQEGTMLQTKFNKHEKAEIFIKNKIDVLIILYKCL